MYSCLQMLHVKKINLKKWKTIWMISYDTQILFGCDTFGMIQSVYLSALRQKEVCTHGLRGELWCHAVFADGQLECVFNTCHQFRTRNSEDRTAGAQTKVQAGAVICTLQAERDGGTQSRGDIGRWNRTTIAKLVPFIRMKTLHFYYCSWRKR